MKTRDIVAIRLPWPIKVFMLALGWTLLAVLVTPVWSTSAAAQTTALRVDDLLSRTKPGQEHEVACDRLDATVGQALIDRAHGSPTESLERLTTMYRLAERAGRCAGADATVGAALNALSDVLYARGQLDAALEAAQESVRIHERLNDPAGLAEGWNRVGNVRAWVSDYPGALEAFQHALDHTTVDDEVGRARAWNNIANVERSLGDFEGALDHYRRALEVFDRRTDRLRSAVVTRNIADVYFRRGENRTALEYSLRALAMNREVGDPTRLSSTLDVAAGAYEMLGAYRKALLLYQEALAIRLGNDDRLGAMETTHNIGLLHHAEGDYELAIDAYKRSIHLNRVWGLRDDPIVAEALRNIGAAAWELGQHDRAIADFRAGLAIAERMHLVVTEGALVHDLGQAALERHRLAEATALFDRSLAHRRRIGDQAGITESLASLAAAKFASGDPDAALTLARSSVENAVAHDQPELLWRAETLVGVVYRHLGRRAEARAALTEAVRTVEQLSNEVGVSENLRQQFFANKLSPYHELIALLVDEHAYEAALDVAEQSKARALVRLLERTPVDEAAALTAAEQRQRTRLRDRLFALNRQIDERQSRQPADEAAIGRLETERREARQAMARFDAATLAAHPDIAAARGGLAPLGHADIDRLVAGGDTAILEFVVADRQLHAFVITADGGHLRVDHHATAIDRETLEKEASRFHERVASRDFGVLDDARAMFQRLVAPSAAAIANTSHLIIVPDGPLWDVPFQALRGPKGYLIEQAAVSYAPSLTALREIVNLPRPAGPPSLLAVGKSAFGIASEGSLDALPDADRQVTLIRDIYGADRSAVFLDTEATERHFKEAAPRYSVLHLATHAVLDESSPMYSHFVLSPAPDDPADDGRLEAWELMGLKLRADLVVLAACETGRGRIASGEGVIGMMWALFAAGARSLVVSQFRVESQSTTALLVTFHRLLATTGGSKADHLRAAAIELLHSPRYAHPYYWAGFVLVGDSH